MRRGFSSTPVIAIIGSVIVVGILVWLAATQTQLLNANTWTKNVAKLVTCTDDAKICPDGSSVGREGPNCDFASCPSTNTNTTNVNSDDNINTTVNSNVAANTNTGATVTVNQNTNTSTVSNTNTAVSTTAKTYTSSVYGVSFQYGKDFAVQDAGQTIYVYDPKTMKATDGQYIKIYEKTAGSTLAAAVQQQFLTGYASADCYTKADTSPKPASWSFVDISYPMNTNANNDPWANAAKCPSPYTATNGAAYFAMDPAHPTKFFFFSIGQYGIPGTSMTVPWQETVKVQ